MSWVTFETVAIYDEQGEVKLATAAGGEHVPKDMSVQPAAARISAAVQAHVAAAG